MTSTFVEAEALQNEKAAYGYSRDSRPDCKQVCIGLVVTPEGLPLAVVMGLLMIYLAFFAEPYARAIRPLFRAQA